MLHPSNRCRGFASEHSITCHVNPSLHVSKDWMFLCACNVECAKVRAVPTVQMVWIFSRTTWNDIEIYIERMNRMNMWAMWGWLRSFRRQKALGKSIAFDSAPGRLSGHLDTRIGRRKRRDQETDLFWCYVSYVQKRIFSLEVRFLDARFHLISLCIIFHKIMNSHGFSGRSRFTCAFFFSIDSPKLFEKEDLMNENLRSLLFGGGNSKRRYSRHHLFTNA